jgi:hypoxanthine phosphoribosyltransferase
MTTKQINEISYAQFQSLVSKVCRDIVLSQWRPDVVVGVAAGGLFSAVMISNYFRTPLVTLNRDTTDLHLAEQALGYVPAEEQMVINSQVDPSYRKNILIVDDINNTGKLFNWIQESWQTSCLPKHSAWDVVWGKTTRVAAIVDNLASASKIPISYSGMEINMYDQSQWINFPYDQWWK